MADINQWARINEIFSAWLDREEKDQRRYLDEACGGDAELLKEVELLIAAHLQSNSFLEVPVIHAVAESHAGDHPILETGQRIGSYRILGEVGRGGMGAVYLAARADDQYQKQVAIKVIKRGMDTHQVLRSFRNERQILASFDHPNIARLLDAGSTESGLPYFVMEYVEGKPVDQYCNANDLNITQRLELFRLVCAAVSYAHRNRVIHRDLKPGNILVTADGIPKLLDFGIAKLLAPQSDRPTTHTAFPAMTPEYASPEQAVGGSVNTFSDIYSLGVVLYEVLTGRLPYEVKTAPAVDIARIITETKPQLPSAIANTPAERKRLRGDLDNIVLMAMRKEPQRRYLSVEQFSEDIRRHLEGLPVVARKDTVLYRGTKFFKRHKVAVGFAVLAVISMVITGAALMRVTSFNQRQHAAANAIPSLAILPFTNVNLDPKTEYLSDGLTDSIINNVSRIRQLRVMAHSAVLTYKNKAVDPREVGKQLGVDKVVMGKLQVAGDTLKVAVNLVDAREGTQLWNGQYDSKLSGIIVLQSQISKDISGQLSIKLSDAEETLVTKHYTENTTAYQLYLKGQFFLQQRSPESTQKAMDYFRQSMGEDPSFALSYVGLADCYDFLGVTGALLGGLPPKTVMPHAKELAMKAIELDRTLAQPHTTLGHVHLNYDWDWDAAEQEFNKGAALNPNDAFNHAMKSLFLVSVGRNQEAQQSFERFRELDTGLSPGRLIIVGLYYYWTRQYDEAIAQFTMINEIAPSFPNPYCWLGAAHMGKHDYKRGTVALQKAVELSNRAPVALSTLGVCYARSGNTAEAQRILVELQSAARKQYVPEFYFACLHGALGNKDEAFRLLDRAYEEHANGMSLLKVIPLIDELRGDPRFTRLLQRLKLR